MGDKKSLCKFEDYVEPKTPQLNLFNTCSSLSRSLAEFKLERIYPRNINLKLSTEGKENTGKVEKCGSNKNSSHTKGINTYQNKFYHEYLSLKEDQAKNKIKKGKISHIFNIRSINLVEKARSDNEREMCERNKLKYKLSSKDLRRNLTEKHEKEDLKGLNFLLVDKKSQSPDRHHAKKMSQKKIVMTHHKNKEGRYSGIPKNGDDKFENKLNEYYQYLSEHCETHGIKLKEIESYGKHTINFTVGRGNNGHLIKQTLKKRWWWTILEEKSKRPSNLLWTQLKQKEFYVKKNRRSLSSNSETLSKRSEGLGANRENSRDKNTRVDFSEVLIHNHFENNEFLGNKKALFYNMKAYYQKQNKNVFDYLPVTFHVKRYNDETWKEFTKYYSEDIKAHEGERRVWIVKPGENSNRGYGITIYSDFEKIKQFVESEISGYNNSKKTLIIQKYIDKPFLYNKRKFDIRCYMLLVRLNGSIKGYWYNEGYIRTSCYDYQLEDTENTYIHLTNDAIQVNCDKYGKYEDGNKLSYHNFQKYLDQSSKRGKNFMEDICPQLKKIATDSIEATYHLLGAWTGVPTFEIFGIDFMIDEDFKPWLIEINTNPCLETASTTLERVIPRMVDSSFKLSVDLLFPPPQNWTNSKKHYLPNRVGNNLFELIFDESKKDSLSTMISDNIIVEMGEIEEDNQIYEQTDKQPTSNLSAHPSPS